MYHPPDSGESVFIVVYRWCWWREPFPVSSEEVFRFWFRWEEPFTGLSEDTFGFWFRRTKSFKDYDEKNWSFVAEELQKCVSRPLQEWFDYCCYDQDWTVLTRRVLSGRGVSSLGRGCRSSEHLLFLLQCLMVDATCHLFFNIPSFLRAPGGFRANGVLLLKTRGMLHSPREPGLLSTAALVTYRALRRSACGDPRVTAITYWPPVSTKLPPQHLHPVDPSRSPVASAGFLAIPTRLGRVPTAVAVGVVRTDVPTQEPPEAPPSQEAQTRDAHTKNH